MKNIQEKITEVTNFKSKYVKSLRMNYLYYKTKAYKKIQSKKDIEKTIYNKLKNTYSLNENYYNIKIINDIITNQKSHLVAEFKDFLIKDDISEFIYKFYSSKESKKLLITIFNYYNQTSVVFPNYILLTENKYLYKNIQRKQKLINILEEKDEHAELDKKKSGYDTDDILEKSSKVFNSNILDSILNESNTSQIKKSIFGISPENSTYTDNDGNNKLNILVDNINQIEENYYNDFLNKKTLKVNNNEIINKNIDKNNINIKNIMDNINLNNKNGIIKRNRHNIIDISKFTKYTKFIGNKYQLKNNKKRSRTESIKNNKNIIFNNIYKTDLYLNINNNIIINKENKNKSNYYISNIKKNNHNKLKKIDISKDFIHAEKTKNKYIKKNDINNLLLSIETLNKDIFNNNNIKISESRNENNLYKNKNILKQIKNKTDFTPEKNNKQTKNNDKIMINNFKNTLNNLMSVINKKSIKRNINKKQNILNSYKSGYSSRYSSSINKKEKFRFTDIFYDSMMNIKSKSMKLKNKKIQNLKESITTFRRNISNDNKLSNNYQKNSKYKTVISSINEINPRKNKLIIDKLNQYKNKNFIKKEKINNYNHSCQIKNKEIFSLTTRESNIFDRNKYYNFKNNFKINSTSFLKNENIKYNKNIWNNQINVSNFNNILFGRPKSFRFKKEYFENIIHNNNKIKKRNLSMINNINNYKKIQKTDFNNILKGKVDKRSKSVKYKRNSNYNNNNNSNKNLNRNAKKEIKKFNNTYTDKNNNSSRINYSQLEMKKKKYKDKNNNRKEFKINNNIFKNIYKPNVSSYTDRIYQKKI